MFALNSKYCVSFSVCVAFLFLYKIETDVQSVSAVSYEFRNINQCELFRLLTHLDTVSLWFKWIKHFREADHRPMGPGKLFHVYYDSSEPIEFKVESYIPNKLIVLESESFLNPRFELRTSYVSRKRSRLMISVMFRRSSALFQFSLGPILQHLTKKKLSESIKYVKLILRNKPMFHSVIDTDIDYCNKAI